MNNLGWIKLHRKIEDNAIFSSEWGLKIWIWCLLRAGRSENDVYFGLTKIHLKKGQFIFGRESASKQLHIKPSTLRNWIEQLKKDSYIDIKPTNKYSIVTVLNWNKYQQDEQQKGQQSDNRVTTDGQQSDTNNNVKNEKNVKKIIPNGITKRDYGNPDINLLINYMKEKLGLPILDESEQTNRNYCQLAIKKFGGMDKVKLLIDATATNNFWSTRITSFKNLYYKGVNIISSGRDYKFKVKEI